MATAAAACWISTSTASCNLCPMSDENHSVSASPRVTSSGCWFGTNGQYCHQKAGRRRLPGDYPDEEGTWVFGLEDRYFPIKRPAPPPPMEQNTQSPDTVEQVADVGSEEMDNKKEGKEEAEDGDDADQSDCISNSTVDGLTDEMMKFLELRLAQVTIKDSEASEHDETSDESTAPPVPPRRKRLQRSQSVLSVAKTKSLNPSIPSVPLVERRIPSSVQTSSASSSSSLSSSSRLGRRGSIAGDVIQRVKRWAAVTTNIRRAFRRVEQISSPSTKPRFFPSSLPPVVFSLPPLHSVNASSSIKIIMTAVDRQGRTLRSIRPPFLSNGMFNGAKLCLQLCGGLGRSD